MKTYELVFKNGKIVDVKKPENSGKGFSSRERKDLWNWSFFRAGRG